MATLKQISDEVANALERPFDTMLKERIKFVFRHELANSIRQEINKFGVESNFRQRVTIDLEEVNRPDNPYSTDVKCLRSTNKLNLIRYKTDDPLLGVYDTDGIYPYIYTRLADLEFVDYLPAVHNVDLPRAPVVKSLLTNNTIVTAEGLTATDVTFTDGLAIFNGNTSVINLGADYVSTFQKGFSAFFKVDFDDGIPTTDNVIFGITNASGYSVILKLDTNGKLNFYYGDVSVGYVEYNTVDALFTDDESSTNITIGLTVSSTDVRLYINGVERESEFQDGINIANIDLSLFNNDSAHSPQYIYIGANDNDGTAASFMDGSIHHFGIYDYTLTGDNIKSLHSKFEHSSKPIRYDFINNYLYIYDRVTASSDRAVIDGIFSFYGFVYARETADNITNGNEYYDEVEYPMSDDLIQSVKIKILKGELSIIDDKNKIEPTHIDNN